MINLFHWLMPALSGWFCLRIASSDSQADTSNSTEQRDMRVVGGERSQNISANDSTVSITATDFDAVRLGLNTADKAFALSTQMVGDSTKTVIKAGLSMFDGALKNAATSNASALNAVNQARSDVAAAWKDSQTPENGMLKIAGFVVVGIAAVGLFAAKLK